MVDVIWRVGVVDDDNGYDVLLVKTEDNPGVNLFASPGRSVPLCVPTLEISGKRALGTLSL